MHCIFCKVDSSQSRSREHVLPESLGNTTAVLPPGVVCDGCNNYFARKVEAPLLETPFFKSLRFHQAVPSKRGLVPPSLGHIGGRDVVVQRHLRGRFVASVGVDPVTFEHMLKPGGPNVINIAAPDVPPDGTITSRFLAKVALEAIALRTLDRPGALESVADDPQLDPLRDHARRGQHHPWPCHSRQIYVAEKRWEEPDGSDVQRVWEWSFLWTPETEVYFVLAIFGTEMAINIAGPSITGYLNWIEANHGRSALYPETAMDLL